MDRQPSKSTNSVAAQGPFVGLENVESDSGFVNLESRPRVGDRKSAAFRFDERHVLYAKLRPYLNKGAAPEFSGMCSTELVPLLPNRGVDREYIAHLLRRRDTVDYATATATGTRMPRADMDALMQMPVPFPSFDEQLRIVGILNRAGNIGR